MDCSYSLNGTIVEKVNNWYEIFLDFSTNLVVIFLNIKRNQRHIVINFQGSPRKVCAMFVQFLSNLNSVDIFSEKLSYEFNKFCPAGSEFFHTKRQRQREKEREKDGWTDRQLDRHDVAFRNFSNASTLWESDVLSLHLALEEMAVHAGLV